MKRKTQPRYNEKCPCGTGFLFKNCCKGRNFKWYKNEDGEYSRAIPVDEEFVQLLDNAGQEFLRIFGRVPREHDPLILGKYLYSEQDLQREASEAMNKAGIPPELIYAHERTGGLLLTESNASKATKNDLKQWHDAIEEYFFLQENPSPLSEEDIAWQELVEEHHNLLIVFGYTLEYGAKLEYKYPPSSSAITSIEEYIFICATRSFKTLRSIKYLLDKDIGADALALCRTIFEAYLRIVFVKAAPNKLRDLVDGVYGLKNGTHEHPIRPNGRPDRRVILNKATGEQLESGISNHRMATTSRQPLDVVLFESIYEFLSEYTHPGFSTAYLTTGKELVFDPKGTEHQHEAMLFSIFFSVLVLDEVRTLDVLRPEISTDINYVLLRAREKLERVLTISLRDSVEKQSLISRLFCVGTKKSSKASIPS